MKTIEIKADKKYIDYINRLLQDINFDDNDNIVDMKYFIEDLTFNFA